VNGIYRTSIGPSGSCRGARHKAQNQHCDNTGVREASRKHLVQEARYPLQAPGLSSSRSRSRSRSRAAMPEPETPPPEAAVRQDEGEPPESAHGQAAAGTAPAAQAGAEAPSRGRGKRRKVRRRPMWCRKRKVRAPGTRQPQAAEGAAPGEPVAHPQGGAETQEQEEEASEGPLLPVRGPFLPREQEEGGAAYREQRSQRQQRAPLLDLCAVRAPALAAPSQEAQGPGSARGAGSRGWMQLFQVGVHWSGV